MTTYDDFCASFPEEANRIDRDVYLKDGDPSLYEQFCTYVAGAPDGTDLAAFADQFFATHALQGEVVITNAGELHGHFCKGAHLETAISLSGSDPSDDITADQAADLIQLIVQASRAKLAGFEGLISTLLADRKMRKGSRMFSFRDDANIAEPFAGDPPQTLLRRQALPGNPPPKGIGPDGLPFTYHYFAFQPPVSVRKPTAFDAGMVCLKDWQPGGLTAPPPPLAGVPEFVHEPVTASSVRWPFDRFD